MKEAILTLVTAVLAAGFKFLQDYLRTKLKPSQYETVLNLARTVVSAADKIGEDFGVDNKAKYDFARNVVQSGARKVGLRLTDNETMAFIHAALKELRELEQVVPFDLADYPDEVPSEEG